MILKNYLNSSDKIHFVACSAGVFFFYLIYAFSQEMLFSIKGVRPYGWHITMMQFSLYSLFGLIEFKAVNKGTRKMSLKNYMLLAFLTVGTMGFSNASLGYLNYPTQVIFKCCKLIPVLIGGIIIQRKVFSIFDCLSCVLMSLGLIFFTLADNSVLPSFNLYGLLLISIALCFDAAIGNLQEKFMKLSQASNSEVVLYSYSIGFVYIVLLQVGSMQLLEAALFCWKNPVVYLYTLFFSCAGYMGVNVVLTLVKKYGALLAVTVTTLRKGLTIAFSFLLFSKPFTFQYVWSGLIVLLGIYFNVYGKNRGVKAVAKKSKALADVKGDIV